MNFVDRIFDAPLLYTGVENLLGVYGYALQIYCDFSGYSDMAIGIALLLGFRFNINFDSPYQSATITEFLASLAYLSFLLVKRLSVYILRGEPEGEDSYLYESDDNDAARRVMAWGFH